MNSLSKTIPSSLAAHTLLRGAAAFAVLLACPVYGAPGDTELISVSPTTNAAAGASFWPSISADGRFVAFSSSSSTLDTEDGVVRGEQIFVRDRLTEQTTRVDVTLGGGYRPFWSGLPSVSADGRYVAFESGASDLVPNDTNSAEDVFVRDLQTGLTERVSVSSDETEANANLLGAPSISADGRYVSFTSEASNLVPGDTNAKNDAFVRDRLLGVTERVSVGSSGQQGNDHSWRTFISADGLHVVFLSEASNLVPNDVNGSMVDVFVRDRATGLTELVSVSSSGAHGNWASEGGAVSEDGRYVAFASWASNLVPNDTNRDMDVFVRDRLTGLTERVSVASNGAQGNGRSEPYISISPDGRYVAFASVATNLVLGDTNGVSDIFVRDRQSGTTQRVSVNSDGAQAAGTSVAPSISADGRYVAFMSDASNLVTNDFNISDMDVFVHELGGSTPPSFGFALKPTARAYGNQALYTSTTMSFWLSNKGTAPLPIKSVSIVGLNPAMFSSNNRCGSSVAFGAGCSIRVTFRPTSVGDKSAKLRVVAGDNDVRTKALSGNGVRSPFTVSPTALDFGSGPIGTTSAAKVVTITNTGRAALPISSIALGGWSPYQFAQTNNCPANLALGATCRISVVFKPTKTGSKAALVQITPGSGAGAIRSVALVGAGR